MSIAIKQRLAFEILSQQLQSDIPVAIEMALKAAEQMLEAAGRLVEQHYRSKDVQLMLVRGSYGVLEGTMKVSSDPLALSADHSKF